jgi:hypothetical protein
MIVGKTPARDQVLIVSGERSAIFAAAPVVNSSEFGLTPQGSMTRGDWSEQNRRRKTLGGGQAARARSGNKPEVSAISA